MARTPFPRPRGAHGLSDTAGTPGVDRCAEGAQVRGRGEPQPQMNSPVGRETILGGPAAGSVLSFLS